MSSAPWFLTYTLALVAACGGSPFEQGSPAGSELAGAAGAAGAVSIGTGGSSMLSGAAGVAGSSLPGNKAGNGGAGGELEPAAAGAGGELEQPVPMTCDRSTWKLTAFATSTKAGETPAAALDGALDSRWSSGLPRAAGQWLELELGSTQTLEALELRTPGYAGDVPSSLLVKVDGKAVATKLSAPETGVLRVAFEARAAKAVRLELDGESLAWWSVSELVGACR